MMKYPRTFLIKSIVLSSIALVATFNLQQAHAQASLNMTDLKFKEGKYQTHFHLEVKQNQGPQSLGGTPKNKIDPTKLNPEQQVQLARQNQMAKIKPSAAPQSNLLPPKILKKSICLTKEDFTSGSFMQKISDDNRCKTVVANDGNKKNDFLIDVQCPEKFKLPGRLHINETSFDGNYKMDQNPQSPLTIEANFSATRTGNCK